KRCLNAAGILVRDSVSGAAKMMTLPSFLAAATVSSQLPAGLAAAVALAGDCAAATLGFVLAAGGALAGLEGAGAAVPPQPARIAPVKTAPTNVRTLIISVSLLRESHGLYIAFAERDPRLEHFEHILTVGLARSLLPTGPFGLIVEGD